MVWQGAVPQQLVAHNANRPCQCWQMLGHHLHLPNLQGIHIWISKDADSHSPHTWQSCQAHMRVCYINVCSVCGRIKRRDSGCWAHMNHYSTARDALRKRHGRPGKLNFAIQLT